MFLKRIHTKKKESELVTFNYPHSHFSEEYRILRTNIQYSLFDQSFKTLLVTSALSGEGKSTIASNLAIVFASQGKKVLLVDADLRKPTIHLKFGVQNKSGLTSYLVGSDVDVPIISPYFTMANLSILTSGFIPPNPSELLASAKMNELIKEMSTQVDVILFDAPPITLVTDAQILASKVDGTIFVSRKGVADRQGVKKSKELLDNVQAKVIGSVLNGRKEESRKGYSLYKYS